MHHFTTVGTREPPKFPLMSAGLRWAQICHGQRVLLIDIYPVTAAECRPRARTARASLLLLLLQMLLPLLLLLD